MKKTTFGIIVATREFFNPEVAALGRNRMIEKLNGMGHKVIILSEGDTNLGCVENFDEAQRCAKLFIENANDIGGVIITAPNFGDETSVANAISLSKLDVPILVHGADDNLDKMNLEQRRDSFCGKISI